MRLQAIRKRCLASKQMIIINGDDGAQWISDGANAYAIVGIRIRESYIQDVFGLTDKQMDKMLIRTETRPGPLYRETYQTFGGTAVAPLPSAGATSPRWNPKDSRGAAADPLRVGGGASELEEMRTVWAYDQKIYALRNADGILYVPEDAILAACKPEDYISYQLTHDERGRLLVAIIRGMFCEALLSPVSDDVADDISEKLRKVGNMPILRTTIREEETDEDEVAER